MLENNNMKFLKLIPKLGILEFIGLAKILHVDVVDEEKNDRQFEEIVQNMVENFSKLPRKNRRELLRFITNAAKAPKIQIPEENVEGAPSSETSTEVEHESEN